MFFNLHHKFFDEKKILETNSIMSGGLFWVAQPKKEKKLNDFSPDFVEMATLLAFKFFSKFIFSKFISKTFFFNIFHQFITNHRQNATL